MKRTWLVVCALVAAPACGSATGTDSSEAPRRTASPHPAAAAGRCKGNAVEVARGRWRVRMRVDPCRVAPDEAPEVTLTNTGDAELAYGLPFKLEMKGPGGWRWVNRGQAFRDPLLFLEPGGSSDPEPVAVFVEGPEMQELEPGAYRVTKEIDPAPGRPRPRTMRVSVRFEVDR